MAVAVFSEITEKDCVKERYLNSSAKSRLVQNWAGISATAELLSSSFCSAEAALQHFQTLAGHLRLRLSWQKTKIQNLGVRDDVGDVTICNHTVEGVSKFVYLGSQQSSMGTCTGDYR